MDELVRYGNNGYGRDGAHRVLANITSAGLLKRDVIVSALRAYDVSSAAQRVIADLIGAVAPCGEPALTFPNNPARKSWENSGG